MTAPTCVHLVFDVHGNLVRVTPDNTEVSMAEAEGLHVSTNATAEDIIHELGCTPPCEMMDDGCWKNHVAPALRKLADQYLLAESTRPLFESTARDLPHSLASMRLVRLMEVFAPVHDLGCYVEAAEVVMATKHDRDVNPFLLGEQSLPSRFFAYMENTRDVLVEAYLSAQEQVNGLLINRRRGQSTSDREKRAYLRAAQEEAELKFILDRHQEAVANAG